MFQAIPRLTAAMCGVPRRRNISTVSSFDPSSHTDQIVGLGRVGRDTVQDLLEQLPPIVGGDADAQPRRIGENRW